MNCDIFSFLRIILKLPTVGRIVVDELRRNNNKFLLHNTPKQNEVTGRNHIMVGLVQWMECKAMRNKYWVEVIYNIVYLLSKCPIKVL